MRKAPILAADISIFGLSSLSAFAEEEPTTCSLAALHGTPAWEAAAGERS